MKLKAYGKINLSLDVLSKRADGYHEIDTVMQEINCYDEIILEKRQSGFELVVEGASAEISDNLIEKAWRLLEEKTGRKLPMTVLLKKNLPIGAGLGGGSSDAAYFIQACMELWNLSFDQEELLEMSRKLGADVYYFFQRGTVRARGIGNQFEELDGFTGQPLLLVNDGTFISTQQVYEKIIPSQKSEMDLFVRALTEKNYRNMKEYAYNAMEKVVYREYPHLALIKNRLENLGAYYALMSGSGASIFAVFPSEELRDEAYERVKGDYDYVVATETRG